MEIAALGLKVQGVENIDKARDSLGRFVKSAGDAEKATGGVADGSKKAGTSLADVVKNSNSAGGALGKVASSAKLAAVQLVAVAAAAMGIGQITKTLAGFEQSMASVAAITRASASEMDAMRKVAKQLGAETEFSASQAADGFKYLGLAGWSAEQSIAAIPSVVDLATAASLGLADAANITSNIMSAYSIEAERAADVTDILAGVSSRANTDVSQLGDAMKYVGPVAASLNISVGDTAAALGVLADASIQGGMGGTALRTVISSLIKPTGDAEKALKAMGLSLSDVNPATNDLSDIVGKLAEKSLSAEQAVTIFGIQGASAISALVAQSPKLAALTEETGNMADEAKRMADVMRDNLQGDLLGFGSALEGVVIAMGEAGLTKVLRTATQGTTELLREMTKLITYMGDNLPAIAGTFGLIFAPQILAAAVGGVKLITAGVVALGGALKAAALSNPITAVIAVSATFLTYLYSIRDEVSAVGAAFDTMGDIVSVVFNEIKDIAVLVFDGIKAALTTVVGVFTGGADNIEITWLDTFSAIFKAIDAWYGSVLGIVAGIGGAFRAMGENIKIVFNNVRESISNAMLSVSGLLDNIGLGFDVDFFDAGGPRDFIDVTAAAKKAFTEMSGSVNTHAKFMGLVVERELKRAGKAANDWAGTNESAADAFNVVTEETKKNTVVVVENTKKTSEAAKAAKKFADERAKAFQTQRAGISALQEERRKLEDQIATFGKSKLAIDQLAISRLKEQAAVLAGFKGSKEVIELLKLEIEEREKLLQAGFTLEALEEGKKAADDLAQETKRTHDSISESLTDALLRGFESGKGFAKNLVDTLKNMFNTLVLRPVIQPIAEGAAGAITGALGLGGAGKGGLGGIFSGISSVSQLGSALSGGLVSGLASSIGSIGSAFGSSALTSFAAGMKGSTLAAGLAGPTTTGAGGMMGAGAMAGAALPWVAGGLAVASLIPKISKMFKGETRSGGGFGYNVGDSNAFFGGGPSGGYGGQETLGAMTQLLKGQADLIQSVLTGTGTGASVSHVAGAFESSDKGRGGTFSGGWIDVDGESVQFGTDRKGQGYGGKSGSVEEMFANMEKDFAFSALEAFQAVSDRMPEVINRMLADVDIRGLTAEQAQQSVALIQQTVLQVNALIEALDLLPFENLKGLSFDLAASLAEAAGGFDALMTGAASYYDAFFSEQEKYEVLLKSTADEVSRLGYELPDTRDGFRGLVESLDAMDSSNHDAIATLLKLSGAADQVYAYQEKLADEAIIDAQRRADELSKIAQELAAERDRMAVQITNTARSIMDTFAKISDSISSSFMSLRERITLDIMDNDEDKYNYYKNQYDSLAKQLTQATDANMVQSIVQQMTAAASNAYNLLDEGVRKDGKGQEFLSTLDYAHAQAQQQLDKIKDYEVSQQENSERIIKEMAKLTADTAKEVASILDVVGDKIIDSSAKSADWAGNVETTLATVAAALNRLSEREVQARW